MVRDPSKPKGRMSGYSYFVQTCREEHKKKHPDESIVFAEFSKKCAGRWKTMTDKEKKRFHELSETDKTRYEHEMASYLPPKGMGRGGKRKKKDPNAPKRAMSGFFWFCQDGRQVVRNINPGWGVGDVAKELGKRWGVLAPDVKANYNAMAQKDKKRYEIEMKSWKSKGTFGNAGASSKKFKKAEEDNGEEEDDDEEEEDDEEESD
ncbi:PREDICTED: high mobility group protein DSP1-like isoform X1 [Priapulus caudatus]|uniref:High mobility group protein DSP1-like isoform X1 n=1 Tax=Priapulus caudatus TaxID=37621 RepID=A0ABM1EJ99_PRICU|nr:PREDICTED: high mobility group protein DSP1-like isoform X1 [Priapulus caudatus]XP_014672268.1 PREDICTED: high mobility group protein DSP1-like isoform X1 [Priapulus caudatus]XP_014672269.1 PREDICTED: high mobility group protein DSP1-like isoform X1 [Priapulus caudatus]XP_014672270.1 PREDICTED: high mobility group protein DSP1-like isoform X1 [Priapulus caudatus]XP_014672271.1 PREDICTED: high mobility group protein DSP1-like isoform X1 [Priapulus caudatus]